MEQIAREHEEHAAPYRYCVPIIERAYAERFSVQRVRHDFPVLHQSVHGKPLVYFDNAATSQKPQVVIDAVRSYYEQDNSNVHRGVHTLSQRATAAYEGSRETIRAFLNAASTKEIVFVRGATEGINLVAQSWGRANIREGDEIVISEMEHHSNIVPWQLLRDQTGATLRVVPMNDAGELDLAEYRKLLSARTKLVAINAVSNALGTINPTKAIIDMAHEHGARVLVDGCQAVPHMAVDVVGLDCDFFVFSGHKLFAPTGIGVLHAKQALLEEMPPWHGGGDMIDRVTLQESTWADLPHKFEAGTPHIAGAIGLGRAIEYVTGLGMDSIGAYEHQLLEYATEKMTEIPEVRIVGTAERKAAVISFLVEGAHPHDIGTLLDMKGIAVRVGHHCAQPVMQHYGIPATARASFAFYNTREEIDLFVAALRKIIPLVT